MKPLNNAISAAISFGNLQLSCNFELSSTRKTGKKAILRFLIFKLFIQKFEFPNKQIGSALSI